MNLNLAIIATLIATVLGLPQYNYPSPSQLPSGNYGTPSQIGGIGGGGIISGGGFGGSGFGGSGIGGGSIGGGGIGGGIGGGGSGISSGGIGGGGIGGGGFNGGEASGVEFNKGGFSGGAGGVSGGGGVLVQKHIYVHVAPPEPEEFRQQRPISAGQATKHYKIIFIKAPSAPAPSAQALQLAAQSQEKTLIYVLVKKPEEAADITVPTASPTQPSKPEVYFIRYKAKNEAIGGGSNIGISGGNIGESGTSGIIEGGSGGSNILDSSVSTGSSGSSISIGSGNRPSAQYGPPGQSGPY